MSLRLALLVLIATVLLGGTLTWRLAPHDSQIWANDELPKQMAAFTLESRPQKNRYLFDYASALRSCA